MNGAHPSLLLTTAALAASVVAVLGTLEARKMEARAFGRGAIAATCKVLADRYPDLAERPSTLAAPLADCRPYLDELDRRTRGGFR